ncbi:HlyD family secretion protein [Poseidonocella sp. HB161398]|uniref:HlyD family secretion protein n=1 Tax=Poseidonocella sp. HB161398 TaxID=2320855 RepID=UPI001109F62D|nr:biotin/lipoyl-binding protein [Poseidonocella sp. HB161398]
MIELLLTSFPFLARVLYLRLRHREISLYSVHRSLYVWFLLFLALIFTIEYYHPESETGVVPFRVVPVVAERGGTVTSIEVAAGRRVAPGDLLFTVNDASEEAAVAVAQSDVATAQEQVAVARSELQDAQAQVDSAQARLDEADVQLSNQQGLRDENSPAYSQDRFLRAQNDQRARAAEVAGAKSQLETARLEAENLAPAQLAAAEAALKQAQVELDKTRIRAQVSGRIEQVTLNVGDRAAQIALNPAMVIIPDPGDDYPAQIVAGFSQVNMSVLHAGMPAEVACAGNINNAMQSSVLPARIVRIQDSISSGQILPTGRLIQPGELARPGEVVAYLALEHPEQRPLLVNGSRCLVQAYTTRIAGRLAGTALGEVIQAWAIEKAVVMRLKVWIMLATGAGLVGSG